MGTYKHRYYGLVLGIFFLGLIVFSARGKRFWKLSREQVLKKPFYLYGFGLGSKFVGISNRSTDEEEQKQAVDRVRQALCSLVCYDRKFTADVLKYDMGHPMSKAASTLFAEILSGEKPLLEMKEYIPTIVPMSYSSGGAADRQNTRSTKLTQANIIAERENGRGSAKADRVRIANIDQLKADIIKLRAKLADKEKQLLELEGQGVATNPTGYGYYHKCVAVELASPTDESPRSLKD